MEASPPTYERGPDPTTATTAQTLREVSHLREVITLALSQVSTRVDGIEAAHKLFRHDLTQFPSEVDKAIAGLKSQQEDLIHGRMAVAEERFGSIQRQFADLKHSLETAFQAAESAITKSDDSISLRIEHGNEFRKTLTDQAATFMSRTESMSRHAATHDKLEALDSTIGKIELAAAALNVQAVRRDDLLPVTASIETLRNRLAEHGGKEQAASRTVSVGLSVAALVVSLVGVGAFSMWGNSNKTPPPMQDSIALEASRNKRIDDVVARLDSLSLRLNAQLAPTQRMIPP